MPGGRPPGKTLLNSGSCIVETCPKGAVRRGYCHAHYSRWRRHGDPLTTTRALSTPGVTTQVKKNWVDTYKLEKGCADCGYNAHPAALDFDHRPGTEKVRDIKSGTQLGWQALMDEVAKCDVVCANCHRIRTVNRRKKRHLIRRRTT